MSSRRDLVEAGFCGDLALLYAHARTQRLHATDPASEALAALFLQSGNVLEIGGYRRLAEWDLRVARALFKTVRTTIARRLLDRHAEIADEVLAIDWVRDALWGGPLARLSRAQQAWKILRVVLIDSRYGLDLQARGLFAPQGEEEAALAIHYIWQRGISQKAFLARSVEEMHVQGRELLRAARRRHGDDELLELLELRAKLAWDVLAEDERRAALGRLEGAAVRLPEETGHAGIRLAILATLADAGVRFRDAPLARKALSHIRSTLGAESPRLTLQEAWAALMDGQPSVAHRLASTVASRDGHDLRAKASQVLEQSGDSAAAAVLLKTVPNEFRPRVPARPRSPSPTLIVNTS